MHFAASSSALQLSTCRRAERAGHRILARQTRGNYGEAVVRQLETRSSVPAREQVPLGGQFAGYVRKTVAARYLGISIRTLSKWMALRVIPFYRPSYKVCLFRLSDLDAALSRFRIPAIGDRARVQAEDHMAARGRRVTMGNGAPS